MADVVVDWELADTERVVCAKISDLGWELNVRASASEFALLHQVRDADWNERRSLPVGSVGGASAFWSYAEGRVTVLVGRDDETWDVAIEFSVDTVDELLAALALLN